MEDDEDPLWQELKKTVKPLKNPKPVIMPVIKIKSVKLPDRDILPPAIQKLNERPAASPLPAKRLKQLRQKKIPVEATLDLHGLTTDKAHQTVKRFLRNAFENNLRCVEIITGKGDPVRGTGLLKRELPQWLGESDLRAVMLHVEENPASRGGSFLVMLRRNKADD